MSAKLNSPLFASSCVSLEGLRQNVANLQAALGDPALDPDGSGDEITNVWYNADTGELVDAGGTTIAGTDTYTAGCGITISTGVISAAVDGTTIICSGGVLSATAAASAYTATLPIAISGGNDISISLGDGIYKDGSDNASIDLATASGLEFTSSKLRDKWRLHGAKGSAAANYYGTAGSGVQITSAATTYGEATATTLDASSGPSVYCPSATTLYLRPSQEGGSDATDQWDTGDARNIAYLVAGLGDFDHTADMYLGHLSSDGTSTLGKWIEPDEQTIWGIDPDGGHTLSVSGTTVTLKLKITKYTAKFFGTVSTVDADVDITHTGEAC